MPESNGLSKSNIESQSASHRHRNLSNLERVGKSGALMIVREDKYLSFSGEATKGRCMQNAVAVAFETSAILVGLFVYRARPRTGGMCREWGKNSRIGVLSGKAICDLGRSWTSPRVGMR